MAVNPNRPTLFAEGNFGANPYFSPGGSSLYTDLTPRLYKQWTVRRGKQFELDAVQAGEFRGWWLNKDGFLDPSNTGGPFAGNVLPYRGYRMRAQYPPSINLLNGDVATCGQVTPLGIGAFGTPLGVSSYYGTVSVTATATPYQGSTVWQVQVPVSAATGNTLFGITYPAIQATPGTPYTVSFQVRCVSGANPTIHPIMNWVNWTSSVSITSGPSLTLTGSFAAPWTLVTLSGTVPFGATSVGLGFILDPTSPNVSWNFQVGAVQFEQNSAASTFSIPGIGYPLYSGLIERYPQSWTNQGTYGLVAPTAVDVFAPLSQTTLGEAFIMDVVATGPQWFFPFNEPSGSTMFQEQAGRTPPAAVFSAAAGTGTLTAGASIAAAGGASGKFYGTNGPVVTISNPTMNQGTVIDLTPAGVSAPSTGGWTRMLGFRSGQTSGNPNLAAYSPGLSPGNSGYSSNMYWGLQVIAGSNMSIGASFYNAAGQQFGVVNTPIVNDNNWHLTFVQMSADGKTITVWVDAISSTSTGANDMHPTLAVNESVGGDEYKMDGTVGYGATQFVGDVALYAQWNSMLTSTQIINLTNSFKTAYQGDSSDQRYNRILGWAGYQGGVALDAGQSLSLGYANDISGTDALTALTNVVNTESGRHFVGVDGKVNFQNRKRYFQPPSAPVWTFGENQGAGEIPYVDVAFDFDPTRISNAVAITQVGPNQVFKAGDTTSQRNYGIRNLLRSNQSTNAEEVRESAYYYLSRYKDPHMRVQKLRINASANPALWPSILAFELGQYVTINRRDQFGNRPTISQNGFIEQITHTGDDQGTWNVDLEISPAATTPYASFTALRTTLAANATAGTNTITISALPDAATNPVRSELTGGQLLFFSGGGNSESQYIATGGVQDQAAGYTSAVITLVATLTNSYPASTTTVVEGGNYDTLAAFDTAQFSY